jgi:hypothetical protein
MRAIIVIWLAIILIVISLSFPPYGYSKYTVSTHIKGMPLGPEAVTQCTKPWGNVGHRFILSDAPRRDSRLEDYWDKVSRDDNTRSLVTVDNMGIGWHIIAIQIAIVIAISCGLILTFYITKK